MINVGHIAKTYGILPSKVLQEATTYDLMIADVMSSWDNYQMEKAMGKTPVPDYSQQELLDMIKKVKK